MKKIRRTKGIVYAAVVVAFGVFTFTIKSDAKLYAADSTYEYLYNNVSFLYVSENGNIKITGIKGTPSKVVIPETIAGKKVTIIGESAFYQNSGITQVELPSTVTSIEKGAFEDCTQLRSINIPNSIDNVGIWAFAGCSKLESISLSTSMSVVSAGVFQNCSSLKSAFIPDSVKTIEAMAFENCTQLASVRLSNSTVEIKEWSFAKCSSLTEITLPLSITVISEDAFEDSAVKTIKGVKGSYADSYASQNGYTFKEEKTEVKGDFNNDGIIDSKDSYLIQEYLIGKEDNAVNEELYDVNSDGVVDSKDATQVMRILSGENN